MGKSIIDKEAVAAPERCRLLLDIDGRRLGIAVVDRLRPAEALYREVELTADAPAWGALGACGLLAEPADPLIRALEDAVYDNPVLLSGFDAVEVSLLTPWLALLPPEIGQDDAASRSAVALASMPEEARDAALLELPAPEGLDRAPWFAMCAPTRLVDFLRRTFSNPRFRHPLEAICEWFCTANPAAADGKMLAHFAPGRLDLLAFDKQGPRFANSFAYADPVDAVYYVMAVREQLAIDCDGELLLCGDAAARDGVVALLRRYVRYAMPLPPLTAHTINSTPDASPPFHMEALLAIAARHIANPNN